MKKNKTIYREDKMCKRCGKVLDNGEVGNLCERCHNRKYNKRERR